MLAQIRGGDLAGAKATAAALRLAEAKERVTTVIAEAQARSGDLGGVAAWAQSIGDPGERAAAYVGAAIGLLPPDTQWLAYYDPD